jgi:hypothetical protein
MKKKLLLLLGVLALTLCLAPAAMAADARTIDTADALNSLGLFEGTGKDDDGAPMYELDRSPTRNEAIVMLIRLLGKEQEALSGDWDMPFTDVVNWVKPYVGYAYAHGLTDGTSPTTFSGDLTVTATQYLTFVLRALGYKDGADFSWDKAWELSDQIGLTNGEYGAESTDFFRGDVVLVSVQALAVNQKDDGETLAEKLIEDGVFTEEQYVAAKELADSKLNEGDDQPETGDQTEGSDKTEGTDKTEGSDQTEGTDKTEGSDQTEGTDKTEDSKNKFTLTYFGDEELHNYLMSLNPDDMITGPSRDKTSDWYWYNDVDLLDEIEAKILETYDIVLIERPKWTTEVTGVATRVEACDDDRTGRRITVTVFPGDGMCYFNHYYIRMPDDLQSKVDQGILKVDPVTKEYNTKKDS